MTLKLKVGPTEPWKVRSEGILYLLVLKLEDTEVIKIGLTRRPLIEERVCEILTGIWKQYRVFPECYVKRFRKTDDVEMKERILLKQFSAYSFTPSKVFTGSTELVTAPLEDVISLYEDLTAGNKSDPENPTSTAGI